MTARTFQAPLDASSLQPLYGMGLRQPHYAAVFETLPKVGFLEVHAENFFAAGGAAPAVLARARRHYPISLHSVGLGLGSALGIDATHLDQLAQLVTRTEPLLVSDHACFARGKLNTQTVHGADLLPLRFTHAGLSLLCSNVGQVQDRLQRRIAVENLSAYFAWDAADFSETDFLNELTHRSGCGILLDANNLYVNAFNTLPQATTQTLVQAGVDFVQAIHPHSVMEIHVAGCTPVPGGDLMIDDHSCPVPDPVWQIYEAASARFADAHTLVEWDLDLPELNVLLAQVNRASTLGQAIRSTRVQVSTCN